MTGLSTSTSISLGWALLAGKKRVPRPAAGNTALRTGFSITAIVSQVKSVVLDPALFRDRFDAVEAALAKRGTNLREQLDNLRQLETERRRLLPEVEGLKREQNSAGEE